MNRGSSKSRGRSGRSPGAAAGFTLLELMIGCFLALLVVLALGSIVLQAQRSWAWARDKAILQANATEATEWIARRVRGAYGIVFLPSPPDRARFRVYDQQKLYIYVFELTDVGGSPRLQENRRNLVDRRCTRFNVTPNSDTTAVQIDLEFEDDFGNRVASVTRCAVRSRNFVF